MAVVGTPTTYTGQPATSHAITFSATATSGNTLLLAVSSAATITTPTGWTLEGSGVPSDVFYLFSKTSDGTETGVTLTLATSRALAAVMIERDDLGDKLTGAQGNATVATNAVTGQAVTTDAEGVVIAMICRAATTVTATESATWGTGWTERGDVAINASANEDPWITLADTGDTGVAADTYTPTLTTAASLPGQPNAARSITVAYAFSAAITGANPIDIENQHTGTTGTPSTGWGITKSGDSTCRGFADAQSYAQGDTVSFAVACNETFTVDIYRLGYYAGAGARLVDTVDGTAEDQPAAVVDDITGAGSCAGWTVNATWTIPDDACPGVYIARPSPTARTAEATHIPFIVRDTSRKASIAVLVGDTTWQAYNYYGTPGSDFTGKSLYGEGSNFVLSDRAFAVSFDRPYVTRDSRPQVYLFNADYPLIRFLERCGYDVDYLSHVDVDADASLLLGRDVVIVSGHNEYWSQGVRDAFDDAVAETDESLRPNVWFCCGNEAFWRVRWDDTYRTMTCYKDSHNTNGVQTDPVEWTGTWQDTRWTDEHDPSLLTGQKFGINGIHGFGLTVPEALQSSPFWRDCDFTSGTTIGSAVIGFESDIADVPVGTNFTALSETPLSITGLLSDVNGDTYTGSGQVTHKMVLMEGPGGGMVASTGTVQWAWALSETHDRGSDAADARAQQATINLLADMGATIVHTPDGLTTPTAKTLVDYGLEAATTQPGQTTTVNGVVIDAGDGKIQGVTVRATLYPQGAFTTDGEEVIQSVEATSLADGSYSLNLIPQSRIANPGSFYLIQHGTTSRRIKVPDVGPVEIKDLI